MLILGLFAAQPAMSSDSHPQIDVDEKTLEIVAEKLRDVGISDEQIPDVINAPDSKFEMQGAKLIFICIIMKMLMSFEVKSM